MTIRGCARYLRLTFLGGKMAMADLGVMEIWWCLGSFSPFKDRLMACDTGLISSSPQMSGGGIVTFILE